MAEESLYFAARANDTSPSNGADVAEVVDSLFTPLCPRRLHVQAGEELATSSNSPRFLTRQNDVSETLNLDDVREDQDDVGDGDSKASADELEELNESFTLAANDRLQILVKLEDDTDEAVLDKESNQVRFDLTDWDDSTQLPKIPEDWMAPRRVVKLGEPDFCAPLATIDPHKVLLTHYSILLLLGTVSTSLHFESSVGWDLLRVREKGPKDNLMVKMALC